MNLSSWLHPFPVMTTCGDDEERNPFEDWKTALDLSEGSPLEETFLVIDDFSLVGGNKLLLHHQSKSLQICLNP